MSRPRIGVLDYGSGNLHSVCRALESAGAEVRLVRQADEVRDASGLVVPGVGAFAACMAQIESIGADDLIRDWVAAERRLLGICVGHQVLFAHGVEHGVHSHGIGIFPGTIEQVVADRLPHMGWNTVELAGEPGVFAGVEDRRFYFVHSYAAHDVSPDGQPSLPADAAAVYTRHEQDRFLAAVQWRSVASTQFHPEKSGAAGAGLLRNWLMG